MTAAELRAVAEDPVLMEVGRRAIEDELVEWRDARLSEPLRGNGFVIRDRNREPSSVIRFGPEAGVKIALLAIAAHLEANRP